MEVGRMEVEDAGVVEVVVVESEGTKEEEGPLASPKRSAVEDVETLGDRKLIRIEAHSRWPLARARGSARCVGRGPSRRAGGQCPSQYW
jgi:hypothetical protein